MKINLQKFRIEWVIACASFALYILILLLPLKAKQFGDGDFHIETKAIASYLHGYTPYEDLSITKAPGPVLFYLLPYFLAGSQPSDSNLWVAGVIWTAFIMTGVLIKLTRSIRLRYGDGSAICFAIFLFTIPIHIYYGLGILAEGPAFIGISLILLAFTLSSKKYFYFYLVGGLILLILSRPNAGLSIVLLGAGSLFFWWKGKSNLSYFWASLATGFMLIFILTMVKLLPNKRASLKQEEYLSYVMHIGRFQFRTEPTDWRFWDNQVRPDSRDYQAWVISGAQLQDEILKSGQPFNEIYFSWIARDVFDNPLMMLKQFFVRILFGNTLQVSSINQEKIAIAGLSGKFVYWFLHISINIINILFLVLAMRYLMAKSRFVEFWPLLMVVAALWIFHGFVYMEQRYLFPIRPIILFLAALSVAELAQKQKRSKPKAPYN